MPHKFLKEYQFDRLDPNTHHQKAAVDSNCFGRTDRQQAGAKANLPEGDGCRRPIPILSFRLLAKSLAFLGFFCFWCFFML